jgi:acetyl-CoA carboxylase biotin carboxyl carrier protein
LPSIAEKLSQLDVSKIMRLVETLQGSKVRYVRIEADGVDIIVSKPDGAQLQARSASPAPEQQAAAIPVSAAAVGVFRLAAASNVHVGARVEASAMLGSIHTLDENTAVSPGVSGLIAEALVKDGDFVEFGQALYRIVPIPKDSNA